MSEAQELAAGFTAAERMLGEYFDPIVQRYLAMQVKLGLLTDKEAEQDFKFNSEESTPTLFCFSSAPWEETWAYGGYEDHCGDDIYITQDFIDNPEKFEREADEALVAREKAQKEARKKQLKAEVYRNEQALLRAKAKLEQEAINELERMDH